MLKPHVLLIEDDASLAASIRIRLSPRYKLSHSSTVSGACDVLDTNSIDIILVDRVLSDGDGTEVIEYCRSVSPQTRIIVCSQLSSQHEKLAGLTAGADDYLTKPFSPVELDLKLATFSRLRRLSSLSTYQFGSITLNDSTGEVHVDDTSGIQLRKKESEILRFLLQHAPQTVSKDQIIEHIWTDPDSQPSYSTLDVYVRRIRMALQSKYYLLETIRGFGYKIVANSAS